MEKAHPPPTTRAFSTLIKQGRIGTSLLTRDTGRPHMSMESRGPGLWISRACIRAAHVYETPGDPDTGLGESQMLHGATGQLGKKLDILTYFGAELIVSTNRALVGVPARSKKWCK